MGKLSVVVISLNEEENIVRCLRSVKGLADEIVVLDSGSVDKTTDIAKKFGAKVFKRKFDNFANQKNTAVGFTDGEWILSLDADEEITRELADEIKVALKSNEFNGFLIPRRNFILGGEIKHSRWSPDKHIWLWKKSKGRWVGDVHEEVVVDGRVGELNCAKLHFQDKTISEFFQTNNKYSELLAKKLQKVGVKFSWFGFFWDPIWEFKLRYIFKLGFLDGWRGFVLCYMMAIYKMIVWIKVWEIQRNK